jgi:hypothetical protein
MEDNASHSTSILRNNESEQKNKMEAEFSKGCLNHYRQQDRQQSSHLPAKPRASKSKYAKRKIEKVYIR